MLHQEPTAIPSRKKSVPEVGGECAARLSSCEVSRCEVSEA